VAEHLVDAGEAGAEAAARRAQVKPPDAEALGARAEGADPRVAALVLEGYRAAR